MKPSQILPKLSYNAWTAIPEAWDMTTLVGMGDAEVYTHRLAGRQAKLTKQGRDRLRQHAKSHTQQRQAEREKAGDYKEKGDRPENY